MKVAQDIGDEQIGENGPVILDGFSCQLQAGELAKLATTSTAELLAALLRTEECGERQSQDAEET